MKLKHYFLIYLAVFAIGYTTLDRLNDAVEVVEAQSVVSTLAASFADPHHPSSDTGELFCDFPMAAKLVFPITAIMLILFALTPPYRFRPTYYHQERFRPPAAVII